MTAFKNILFVTRGAADEAAALEQALAVAQRHKAKLKVLIVQPDLDGPLRDYRKAYETYLREQMDKVLAAMGAPAQAVHPVVDVEGRPAPGIRVVQHVLQHGHDLVIKMADYGSGKVGLRAFDMELLRKCPCPVWLMDGRSPTHIAVAIDPHSVETAGRQLSFALLRSTAQLAAEFGAKVSVIACWDFAVESFLRHSIYSGVSGGDVDAKLTAAEADHRNALDTLLAEAGFTTPHTVLHLRGRPEDIIPAQITRQNIDLLVMGTVARTGIPGFFIGNTAENVLQRISCALLAQKPQGFVSPVKVGD
jgi:nucleotide-binding universal stress UspA family protein